MFGPMLRFVLSCVARESEETLKKWKNEKKCKNVLPKFFSVVRKTTNLKHQSKKNSKNLSNKSNVTTLCCFIIKNLFLNLFHAKIFSSNINILNQVALKKMLSYKLVHPVVVAFVVIFHIESQLIDAGPAASQTESLEKQWDLISQVTHHFLPQRFW